MKRKTKRDKLPSVFLNNKIKINFYFEYHNYEHLIIHKFSLLVKKKKQISHILLVLNVLTLYLV